MRYVCPICKGISNSTIEVRVDEPKQAPQCPACASYWALAMFNIEFRVYELDHWNRTVVCEYCGEAHHYFKGS